jgi:hypothetical protein
MKSSWFSWPARSGLPPLLPSEIINTKMKPFIKINIRNWRKPLPPHHRNFLGLRWVSMNETACRVGPLFFRRWCDATDLFFCFVVVLFLQKTTGVKRLWQVESGRKETLYDRSIHSQNLNADSWLVKFVNDFIPSFISPSPQGSTRTSMNNTSTCFVVSGMHFLRLFSLICVCAVSTR